MIHGKITVTPHFSGRSSEFDIIHDELWSKERSLVVITQSSAATVFGGIGKSTLAREYAWRNRDRYTGVWWLNAASGMRTAGWPGVEQGLIDLGAYLDPNLARAQNRFSAAQSALKLLSEGTFCKPWIVIYDNVDNPSLLKSWTPTRNAHVIITSRINVWEADICTTELGTWSLPEVMTFLNAATARDDLCEESVSKIAEVLHGQPLALAHTAVALRSRNAVSATEYAAELKRTFKGVPNDSEHRTPVFATVSGAASLAEREAPGALAVLNLASFYGSQDIPVELFQQNAALDTAITDSVAANRKALEKQFKVLDAHSLIDLAPHMQTFSVHPLVQAAVRDAIVEDRNAWARKAVASAFAAFPESTETNWQLSSNLAQHVCALYSLLPHDTVIYEMGWLLGAAAEYTQSRGAFAEALPLHEAALVTRQRLVESAPTNIKFQHDVAISYDRIGEILVNQNCPDRALAAFNASLEIRKSLESTYPAQDEWQHGLSISHSQLGEVLRSLGDFENSLNHFKASCAIRKRLLDADQTSKARQLDLALATEWQGFVLLEMGETRLAMNLLKKAHSTREVLAQAHLSDNYLQNEFEQSTRRIAAIESRLNERGEASAGVDPSSDLEAHPAKPKLASASGKEKIPPRGRAPIARGMPNAFDVFISYPRSEKEKATPIYDELTSLGLTVFFDIDNIDAGDTFPDRINNALNISKSVLCCWSPLYFERPWCMIEAR